MFGGRKPLDLGGASGLAEEASAWTMLSYTGIDVLYTPTLVSTFLLLLLTHTFCVTPMSGVPTSSKQWSSPVLAIHGGTRQ